MFEEHQIFFSLLPKGMALMSEQGEILYCNSWFQKRFNSFLNKSLIIDEFLQPAGDKRCLLDFLRSEPQLKPFEVLTLKGGGGGERFLATGCFFEKTGYYLEVESQPDSSSGALREVYHDLATPQTVISLALRKLAEQPVILSHDELAKSISRAINASKKMAEQLDRLKALMSRGWS
jgi:hypothetical protein